MKLTSHRLRYNRGFLLCANILYDTCGNPGLIFGYISTMFRATTRPYHPNTRRRGRVRNSHTATSIVCSRGSKTILIRNNCEYDALDDTSAGRICLARTLSGLSIEEAANQLGVAPERWSDWERDRDIPENYLAPMMAGILGVSLSWLIVGSGEGPTADCDD
ncbi:MAG TPA: helix-turn-helix domain-containing protein [Rhizobiaceae bacterium]|nr:helix-turn-helix domain-containing protein [Rhizobiaceae bacterium]